MPELLDAVTGLQNDPTCMDRLARSSGLHSLAGAQATYSSAVPMAIEGLICMVSTASGAKVLLRRAREFRLSNAHLLSQHFSSEEDSTDDELIQDVFGSDLTTVVRTLAVQHAIDPDSARSVLESATGAALAMAVRSCPDTLTLESLTAPILAEQARFRNTGTARSDSPSATTRKPVDAAGGVDDAPSAEASPTAGRRPWRLGGSASGRQVGKVATAIGVFLAVVAVGCAALWLSQREGAPEALPFVEQEAYDRPSSTVEKPSDDLSIEPGLGPVQVGVGLSPPVPIGAPVNYAVMSGGRIYLRGFVPTAEVEGLIVAAVGDVLGPENVTSEYVIDPDVPFVEGREVQVYIEETVLFETASAEIGPDFLPLLGIGLTLLQLQDGVALEVIGHTDSVGDAAYNQRLSQQRVEAVRQFFVSQGIDAARVLVEGVGETQPRADNETPQGRQANRRVEFLVTGFRFSG